MPRSKTGMRRICAVSVASENQPEKPFFTGIVEDEKFATYDSVREGVYGAYGVRIYDRGSAGLPPRSTFRHFRRRRHQATRKATVKCARNFILFLASRRRCSIYCFPCYRRVRGIFPQRLGKGRMIVCWGNYEDDEQRGVFFQASSVKVVPKEETTGDALLQWCANRMEGVGTKTAEKIVSALGVTSLAELEEEAAKDGFAERLTSVKGLVRSKARFIAEQMRESQGVRSILESFNVHEGAVKSAEHAGISRDDLAANPYASLLNVSAVPVVTLDAIAQHFDPSADFHHDRLAAITFRSLVQACSSDGHCFLHASTLHGRVNRRGDSRVAGDFAKALGTLHRRNAIYLLRESDLKPTHDGCYPFSDAKDEALCYPKALSIAETFCVDEVYKRMRKRQNDSPGREEWCERVDAWFENLAKVCEQFFPTPSFFFAFCLEGYARE